MPSRDFRARLEQLRAQGAQLSGSIDIVSLFRDPARTIVESIEAGLPQQAQQKKRRLPVFRRGDSDNVLAPANQQGGVRGAGLVNALTIGGVPGRLGTQGVAGNPLSLGSVRNRRI